MILTLLACVIPNKVNDYETAVRLNNTLNGEWSIIDHVRGSEI